MKLSTTHTTVPSFFTILFPLADKLPPVKRKTKNSEAGLLESEIPKIDEIDHRTFGELLIWGSFRNIGAYHQKNTEATMWVEEEETIQTWVNGGEVILKKVDRDYAYRLANEAGDWIDGLPDGMVWADAQTLFEDSL